MNTKESKYVPPTLSKYYTPAPHKPNLLGYYKMGNTPQDAWRVKHGMCYPFTEEGKNAAIRHASYLLVLNKEYVNDF